MKITINHYHHYFPTPGGTTLDSLKALIMNNQQEAEAKLDAIGASLDAISADTTGLLALVGELRDAADAAGNLPQSFLDKLDAFGAKAAEIDGKVDAIAPNPTDTPETPTP